MHWNTSLQSCTLPPFPLTFVEYYHAGLPQKQREKVSRAACTHTHTLTIPNWYQVHQQFVADKTRVVVATIAFGQQFLRAFCALSAYNCVHILFFLFFIHQAWESTSPMFGAWCTTGFRSRWRRTNRQVVAFGHCFAYSFSLVCRVFVFSTL